MPASLAAGRKPCELQTSSKTTIRKQQQQPAMPMPILIPRTLGMLLECSCPSSQMQPRRSSSTKLKITNSTL